MKILQWIAVALILGMTIPVAAQQPQLSKKEQRKLLKEERRIAKEKEEERVAFLVDYMVTQGRFVLEANTMGDRRGNSWPVQSTLNFIASDSISGVIQVGNNQRLGSNGLGGTTISGNIVNYSYTKNEKRGTYTADYTLHTPIGVYSVNLSVTKDGWGNATVQGNAGGAVVYDGQLILPQESMVYKGYRLYR